MISVHAHILRIMFGVRFCLRGPSDFSVIQQDLQDRQKNTDKVV